MAETKRRILLAEDDLSLGELLKNYLEMNDFEVSWYKNGIEAFRGFGRHNFDICLLDVMMPEMNGFELAGQIKQLNPQTPFLFLTAKTLREDILAGYKCGADDYILKPFDSELLIFKINAVLKRGGASVQKENAESEFSIGKYLLNTNLRSLKGPGGEQQLSPKETELLKLLCQYKNSVLPRDLALKNIWNNDDYFSGRSMDVYIAKLRKHLKDDPSVEIINIHGKGYRFNTNS
ncbi:MAG: response regulator transcription factor [Bacteroidia bacterium]